jgi:hypothetical protein
MLFIMIGGRRTIRKTENMRFCMSPTVLPSCQNV